MPDTRLLHITSPLGEGALIATRLSVTEALGLPYSVAVEVLGSNHELQALDLLTKEISVTVTRALNGQPTQRHFHGVVSEFQRLGPGAASRTAYRLVAVPGLWRLGLKRNCRIFQDKAVKEIVTTVLGEHDQPSPHWGMNTAAEPIPYCTQFNETDLAFVLRLLEEHGMACYFKHTASAHELHISASAPGFPEFEGGDVQAMHGAANALELGQWRRANQARSARVSLLDMDTDRNQPAVVLNKTQRTRQYSNEPVIWAPGEVFRWPGGMSTRPGLDNAAVLMGEQETAAEEFSADIQDPRFTPGASMKVTMPSEDDGLSKDKYFITTAIHEASDSSGLVAGAGGVETYAGTVTLVCAGRTWMPIQRHPRPVLSGLYSATVTGPSGEEIHVDEFGRIKIKFRWDRLGKGDDTSSCWVRVAQSAAGAWGGTWFLPRIGDEVLVAFLDGDPDRPIVTASVYSKSAPPPFDPKANRTQSGISTRSSKGGSKDDANVLRFEDKKGKEHVFLHAQKDLNVEVENDETRAIDHDQIETIKNARTVTIKDSDDTLTLESGDRSTTLKQGNESHVLKLGNLTMKCDAGSMTFEAKQKITLKVGPSTIELSPSGITIKGPMITSEAQGVHTLKGAMIDAKAQGMAQIDGGGMVIVKGGIVMLN